MKRLLLLSVSCGLALAASANDPQIYPGYMFAGVSPDGTYAVSFDNPATGVMNILTGEALQKPTQTVYGTGAGNFISNDPILVGFSMDNDHASYWKEGKWQQIFPGENSVASYAQGITPDASRIVGFIQNERFSEDYDGLVYVPCYWDLKSDGTYSEPVILPHPNVDLTGRAPQTISANWVSADGNIIGGQIEDYMGYIYQPIIYTCENGTWSYSLLADDLFHPAGLTIPPYPGEEPLPSDYMTPDEVEKYNAAFDYWYEHDFGNEETRPLEKDYMAPGQWEKFTTALKNYIEAFNAFDEVYHKLVQLVPTFEKNNVLMTTDGKYYASTDVKTYVNPEQFTFEYKKVPYLFNVEADTWTAYKNDDLNIYVTSLADDTTLMGQWNDGEAYIAYILTPGAKDFVPFLEVMEQQNPSVAEWMKENMTHSYDMFDPEDGIYETQAVATGTPFATPDMQTIVFGLQNFWEYPNTTGYAPYYGYVINPGLAGVEAIEVAPADGLYRVFNFQGVKVLETKDISDLNRLAKGIYIINGKKIII